MFSFQAVCKGVGNRRVGTSQNLVYLPGHAYHLATVNATKGMLVLLAIIIASLLSLWPAALDQTVGFNLDLVGPNGQTSGRARYGLCTACNLAANKRF